MSIYTRFGSPVEIIQAEMNDENEWYVQCREKESGRLIADGKFFFIGALKATNGIEEILDAVKPVALMTAIMGRDNPENPMLSREVQRA